MRLSSSDINNIITALTPFAAPYGCELRLFGSRVNDEAKGGDIDLMLLVNDENQVEPLLLEKHRMLAAIKNLIGDQKIDLVIASPKRIQNDAFLEMVFPKSVILKEWRL